MTYSSDTSHDNDKSQAKIDFFATDTQWTPLVEHVRRDFHSELAAQQSDA